MPTKPSTNNLPWTDFQIVLVTARHASVAKACKALNMTHATLLRKLEAIESHVRTRLFDRVRGKYTLTTAGLEIAQAAESFLPLALAAESRARGQDLRPSGEVRISVAPIITQLLLPPVLQQFSGIFPDIKIEISSSREHASIRRREADVAIRVSDNVADWLVGRKLGNVDFKIFARKRTGQAPTQLPIAELSKRKGWIGFERDERDLKFDRWLGRTVPEDNVVLRVDNFFHALTMVEAGLGMALLPAFVEHGSRKVQAVSDAIDELRTPLWLITHPEIKNTARINVVMRAFGPALTHALDRMQPDSTATSS